MTVTVYPQQIRSLAQNVDTRVRLGNRRSTWPLSIAGPFCFIIHGSARRVLNSETNNRAEAAANAVSALTGLPATYWTGGHTVNISVRIDTSVRDRLIKEEYARVTEKTG